MDIRSAPWSPSSTSRVASSADSEAEIPETANPEIASSETASPETESPETGGTVDELDNTAGLDDGMPSGRHAKDDSGAVVDEVVVVETADAGDDGTTDSANGYGTVPDPDAASTTAFGTPAADTITDAGDSAAEWSEIKALFVDDPAASVQRASALVERSVEGFMSSLRQRKESLGDWQEGDASGTEELRKALRGYRGLYDQLEQISGQLPSGGVIALGAASAAESASGGRI